MRRREELSYPMSTHWKHRATRCAVPDCERTRRKGWTTCGIPSHHAQGVSLYGLKPKAPRLRDVRAISADRD